MAVELSTYVESLRRAMTPIGGTLAIEVNDDELIARLVDAFWNARLDGFFPKYTVNEDGRVTPILEGDPEFDRANVSLVVLYAAIDATTKQILSTQTKFRAKAGPVEFEQENSATMLVEMLKQLQVTKKRLLDQLNDLDGGATSVMVLDAYVVRSLQGVSEFEPVF